ncbi:MAG TPA: Holliday junction resolvase RuvX [Candidatus Paceibacterota bacterium]|nr:Holliday junction resolvase RuvX [Candidatus Paceibacterota bacterium]
MERGRRIAFDFGDARIGVAVSDPDSILATPVATLETKSQDLWDQIFQLFSDYEPVEVFVGRPIHLAGHESDSTAKSELFAKEIHERFGLDVSLVDERLSTVSAQRQLKDAGLSTRETKSAIDQAAAVGILELALETAKGREKRKNNE